METFVVRVWLPAEKETAQVDEAVLRGIVEHVGSGHSGPFQGEGQLIQLIRADLAGTKVQSERKGGS